jgi:hypothetical protein
LFEGLGEQDLEALGVPVAMRLPWENLPPAVQSVVAQIAIEAAIAAPGLPGRES